MTPLILIRILKLILITTVPTQRGSIHEGGISDVEDEGRAILEPPVPAVAVLVESLVGSFQWLAGVDLAVVNKKRLCLMKSVPGFLKGAYRSAMRVAVTEIDQGRSERDASRSSRNLKLFFLLFRLLLHKRLRGGLVPKKQLQHRSEVFAEVNWASLLISSMEHSTRASSRRSRRRDRDNLESRAARAEALIHSFLWTSTRGAAGGPSGMTAEHMRLILESDSETAAFFQVA